MSMCKKHPSNTKRSVFEIKLIQWTNTIGLLLLYVEIPYHGNVKVLKMKKNINNEYFVSFSTQHSKRVMGDASE